MATTWSNQFLGTTGSVMEESEPGILDSSLSLTSHNCSSLTTGSTFYIYLEIDHFFILFIATTLF